MWVQAEGSSRPGAAPAKAMAELEGVRGHLQGFFGPGFPPAKASHRPASPGSRGQGMILIPFSGRSCRVSWWRPCTQGGGDGLGPPVRYHGLCWHFLQPQLLEGSFRERWSQHSPGPAWAQGLAAVSALPAFVPAPTFRLCRCVLSPASRRLWGRLHILGENVRVWVWIFEVGTRTDSNDPHWKDGRVAEVLLQECSAALQSQQAAVTVNVSADVNSTRRLAV